MGILHPLSKEIISSINLITDIKDRLYDKIPSSEIDDVLARICAGFNTKHPDFGVLASRIAINNLHKETPNTFTDEFNENWFD